ncbi:hypothetical protein C1I98_06545 [Spongiactinospora gelatinilytica]|uniref:Uncharacterized protein n=1 Tax=Spongiactinospora gelatinilytica TaxID=2666298 RepID=A0A2W2HDA5_9ACTN|nr:hypothetical protein [Spongiactinospora gelatinilytica]PZG52929.1 hypothetical protein C1I98_06545 [Spongiactinospora gelatinilytica]
MTSVTFRDETSAGRPLEEFTLPGLPDRISARALVRLRVREEVARHNAGPRRRRPGLVAPLEAEAELNGYEAGRPRPIDWERQADAAEAAFARNGFVLLTGERQIEDLDEEIDLTADPVISFVRLLPLVGG